MDRKYINKHLPELVIIEELAMAAGKGCELSTLAEVSYEGGRLPIYTLKIGSGKLEDPAVLFVGGVHGLERIGTQVITSYLKSILARGSWDRTWPNLLKRLTIYFIPLLNPGGMLKKKRSNLNGVDLMRNAPVEAEGKVPFLAGGHRISPRLPWYRGPVDTEPEVESTALGNFIDKVMLKHPVVLSLDCHSGFGKHSRVWFPYAYTKDPFDNVEDIYTLYTLFNNSFPFHEYVWEPQSTHYNTHGDLWDHFYMKRNTKRNKLFLPLTLEMGSWLWVRKNPRQFFKPLGIFNPIIPHRQRRVLRQNLLFFDFLVRATAGYGKWKPKKKDGSHYYLREQALKLWYPEYAGY